MEMSPEQNASSQMGTASEPGIGTELRYRQILSAIDQLRIMIIEVSAEGEILYANPPAREVFPNIERFPYDKPQRVASALLEYLCTFAGRIPSVSSGEDEGGFPILYEVFEPASGAWYKIFTDSAELPGGQIGLLHVIDDISEWKRHEYELRVSTIDPLSSAYTRKMGFQKLDELIRLRYEKINCVAFIDIDNLKEINSGHGQNEGDFAIKTIAEVLLSNVRGTDWVIRYGGDEFLVLFFKKRRAVHRRNPRDAVDHLAQHVAAPAFEEGVELLAGEVHFVLGDAHVAQHGLDGPDIHLHGALQAVGGLRRLRPAGPADEEHRRAFFASVAYG